MSDLASKTQLGQVRRLHRSSATITLVLILSNLVMVVVLFGQGVDLLAPRSASLVECGANYGPHTFAGQWWRLVSYAFVHAGMIHLMLNMWVLWNIGPAVEQSVGRNRFLGYYFSAAVTGSVLSSWWDPLAVSVGASAAILGVLGVMLVIYVQHSRITLSSVTAQGRNSILLFIVLNLLSGFYIEGVDTVAHVGGLAAGIVGGLATCTIGRLTPALRAIRLATVAAFCVFLCYVVTTLPSTSTNIQWKFHHFKLAEDRILRAYNDAIARFQAGRLESPHLANLVCCEVIEPWRQIHSQFAELKDASRARPEQMAAFEQYLELRAESWKLLVDGLRFDDLHKLHLHRAKSVKADQLALQLRSPDEI